jgi:hypothetical protein
MANDIQKSITANDIKNGSKLVYCSRTGKLETLDNDAVNTPAIEDIQGKYDHRFDDPSYYYGHQ